MSQLTAQIVLALKAMVGTPAMTGKPWTLSELAIWAGIGRGPKVGMVASALQRAGLAEPMEADPAARMRTGRAKAAAEPRWRLTGAGQAAVRATAATDSFEHRVWRLLRNRNVLTASEAADCLVDAGGDVARAERVAVQILARWHRLAPSVVTISAREVGGQRRYVLVRDIGDLPPIAAEPEGRAA
jgi:hypothetical protein